MSSSNILSLCLDSPSRPPDWRWQLANRMLASGQRPIPRQDDSWVHRAYDLARAAQQARAADEFAIRAWHRQACKLDPKAKGLLHAWEIYEKTNVALEDRTARFDLEARILALQPCDEIYNYMLMGREAVVAYEAVFFNVTDRLVNQGWIEHFVFGPDYHKRLNDQNYAIFWKVAAYFGGTYVLNEMVRKCSMDKASTPAEAIAEIIKDARRLQVLKNHIASRTVAINGFTQVPLMEYDLRVRTEEAKLGQGSTGQFTDKLNELLTVVTFSLEQSDGERRFEPRIVIPEALPEAPLEVDWEASNPFDRPRENAYGKEGLTDGRPLPPEIGDGSGEGE